jgi:flagellar basal body rod protein FlgG
VQAQGGERYTRNGALQINNLGQIVTTEGYPVLGTGGPITLQPGDTGISIADDGTVTVRENGNTKADSIRGKIRVVAFDNPQTLTKSGGSLFSAGNSAAAQPALGSRLIQGAIERSNVSAVSEMTKMIDVMRTYTSIATILQQQNDVQKNAIDKLAEVPA